MKYPEVPGAGEVMAKNSKIQGVSQIFENFEKFLETEKLKNLSRNQNNGS